MADGSQYRETTDDTYDVAASPSKNIMTFMQSTQDYTININNGAKVNIVLPEGQIQKWEYLVKRIAYCRLGQEELNVYGENGWELISIEDSGTYVFHTFKRIKTESQD